MKSQDFLDAVKDKHGLPSDRQLSKFLDMSHGRISLLRTGTRKIDDKTAIKVAAALDLPEGYVMAHIQAERATDKNLRRVWRSVAAALLDMAKKGHAAGLALLGIIGLLTLGDTEAVLSLAASVPVLALPSIHYAHLLMLTVWLMLSVLVIFCVDAITVDGCRRTLSCRA